MKTSIRINLKNVATMVALFAATVAFASCDKGGDLDPDEPSDNEALYFDPDDGELSVSLRNVKMRYSYQCPRRDDDPPVRAEAMACGGRSYIKETGSGGMIEISIKTFANARAQ
ncbi:hypothetical protein AGMMS49574_02030 [Bacteroidia bacterium]|nr:hypothetical protein AGMMS49574_02030 [Bacteroidia bacterium]GHU59793.1 hypothetical protein FACS189411_16970 [Bacteroidia bacterium]